MSYYVWHRPKPGLAWCISTGEGSDSLSRARRFAAGWIAQGYQVEIHDEQGRIVDVDGFIDGDGI